MRRRLLACLVLCVLCLAHASAAGGESRVHVVFRYDDYGNASPTEIERGFFDLLKAHGLRCTVGVIPFVRSKETRQDVGLEQAKARLLREAVKAGIVEAAVHGYHHRAIGKYRRGKGNEWAGVPFDEQKGKLRRAKRHLEEAVGAEVVTFLPPWNSYDAETVRALAETGYRCLGASRRGEAVSGFSLAYLPATCTLSELPTAVDQARRLGGSDHVIVVQLHAFDMDPQRGGLTRDQLNEVLAWVQGQEDIRVSTLSDVSRRAEAFDAATFTRNKWYVAAAYLAPPFLSERLLAEHVYLGESIVLREALKAWGGVAATYVLVWAAAMVGVMLASLPVLRRSVWVRRLLKWAGVVAALGVAAMALRSANRNYRGATMVAAAVGGLCGIAWGYRRVRKSRAARDEERESDASNVQTGEPT